MKNHQDKSQDAQNAPDTTGDVLKDELNTETLDAISAGLKRGLSRGVIASGLKRGLSRK